LNFDSVGTSGVPFSLLISRRGPAVNRLKQLEDVHKALLGRGSLLIDLIDELLRLRAKVRAAELAMQRRLWPHASAPRRTRRTDFHRRAVGIH
jgi:hypothetical protein